MTAGVYIFENTMNGKKYVGQSVNVEKRIKRHLKQHKNSSKHPKFYSALRKHSGWMVRVVPVPEEGKAFLKDNLDALEKALIETYRTAEDKGYNLTLGGEGVVGYCHSEESRRKMSKAAKSSEKKKDQLARLNASPEFQRKNREHLARLNSDPEFQQKRAEGLARHHASPEHKKHLVRLHQSQRKLTPSQVQRVFQMREEGFLQREIADHFGMTQQSISRILNGKLYADLR